MNHDDLVTAALTMLRDKDYKADAINGAKVNNSIVGGILAIQHQAPRWAAEAAVREALIRTRRAR